MLTFKQYLSEIFKPTRGGEHVLDHPDLVRPHQDRWTELTKKPDDAEMIEYHHIPKDKLGVPIHAKKIRTSFIKAGDNRWEVVFTVGATARTQRNMNFPSDVTKKVFDHISHFVNAHRFMTRANPTIQYDTKNPKKHRIYQAAAKRLGITAENNSTLNPNLDKGGKHERGGDHEEHEEHEEPWIIEPWWGRRQ
jgi:hypothetical protein